MDVGAVLLMVPGCCFVSFIILFFGLFIGLILYGIKARGRFDESMKALAADLGCQYKKDGALKNPVIEGEYRGRKVMVDVNVIHKTSGSGMDEERFTVEYTRARVWHKGKIKDSVTVLREGVQSKIDKKILKVKEIDVGNPDFDKRYMASGKDEAVVKELLDVDVQKKMIDLSRLLRNVYVESDHVDCEMIGHVADKSQVRRLADLAVDLADKAEKL